MPQNPTICPTTIHACISRFTRLNADGTVASPPNNAYVTDSMIKVDYTPDVDTGDDKTLVTGCDVVRAAYKQPDRFKRWTFAMDLSAQEPALMEFLIGAALLLDGSTIPVPAGFSWPLVGVKPPAVACEFWTENYISDAQAISPQRWSRYIWPMTYWRPDAGTIEAELKTESFVGYSQQNAQWGSGPYGDQLKVGGVVAQPIGKNGGVLWTDTIPAALCGYKATTSGSL
jgi:hypothetical protein